MNLQNFRVKFKYNPSKILEELFFSFFVAISYGKTRVRKFAQNYAETVPLHKNFKPRNLVKLRHFTQWYLYFTRLYFLYT